MRITNEGPEGTGTGGLAEVLRLQAEFQARLAEETLRYLRSVQAAFLPRAPGTVVQPAEGVTLTASGPPGGAVELSLEVENRQRVHSQVTPTLTPLVADGGATWFPAARPAPISALVAPGEQATFTVTIPLPAELPAGIYRGTLVLQGFRDDGVPVVVDVAAAEEPS